MRRRKDNPSKTDAHLFGSFREGDTNQILRFTGWGPFRKARPVPPGFRLQVKDVHTGEYLPDVRTGSRGMWAAYFPTDFIQVSGDGKNWTHVLPANKPKT